MNDAKQEIQEKLTQILTECLPDLDADRVRPESVISRDLGVDSMNFILIICRTESVFGIRIPEDSWQQIRTVQDAVDKIAELLPGR